MNIFVIDPDPIVAGKHLNNKHTVKMVLETAQILCAAHWLNGTSIPIPYKLTHKAHPCVKWAAENYSNYQWLVKHGLSLCEEYTARYGKIHKCEQVIKWAEKTRPKNIKNGPLSVHPICMPDDCKVFGDVVTSYRNYYKKYKKEISTWHRNKPDWFE